MTEGRLKQAIAEYEETVRTLSTRLHTQLVEARLLRRTLETIIEAQRALRAPLERPLTADAELFLRYPHRGV
jgi:hypothetical protein